MIHNRQNTLRKNITDATNAYNTIKHGHAKCEQDSCVHVLWIVYIPVFVMI